MHGISALLMSVPDKRVAVEASSGNKIPIMEIQRSDVTLKAVSQNSISPYLRTLNMLNPSGVAMKTEIQTAGWIEVFGTQNDTILVAATSLAGKATVKLFI